MARRAIQALRRTVTVAWPSATERDAKARLIQVAREGHAKIMADARSRGSEPEWDAYANEPGNPRLESVVLPGPIVYRYRYVRDVVIAALDELRRASPVQSGDYVRSHMVFVGGVPVEVVPQVLRSDQAIWISNPVPYARRLEIGKTKSGRSFVLQVPDRIYQRVVTQKLRPRYGNLARISFDYVTLPDSHVISGGLSSHYRTTEQRRSYLAPRIVMRKRYQKPGDAVRAPAIVIEPV